MPSTELVQAAERFTAAGVRVLACGPDKRPLTKWKPLQDAPPDETLDEFREAPDEAWLAVLTGDRFDVVDVDSIEALVDLTNLAPTGLPSSYGVARTPGGGWHFYVPATGRKNGSNILGSGRPHGDVDYRGKGGYVIVSPSPGYVWQRDLDLDADVPLSAWPALLPSRSEGREADEDEAPGAPAAARERIDLVTGEVLTGHPWVEKKLTEKLADVADATEGTRNATLNTAALDLGHYVPAYLDQTRVKTGLTAAAHQAGLRSDEIRRTIASGLTKGMSEPKEPPARTGLTVAPQGASRVDSLSGVAPEGGDVTPVDAVDTVLAAQAELSDSEVARRLCEDDLADWLHTSAIGWRHWTGKVWEECSDDSVRNAIDKGLRARVVTEVANGASADRTRALIGLLGASKQANILRLAQARLDVPEKEFTEDPDLLNTPEGVVDLTTGKLFPHDRELRLTKITRAHYKPNARHPDWEQALQALPADVRDWMQLRFGQAITGHTPPDDMVPICVGSGSNAKSTLFEPIGLALGGYALKVPDRVLTAHEGDHPTELMSLKGVRYAYIEELNEDNRLNTKRLKDVTGGNQITARLIRHDNVTFPTTHSLFVSTNFKPRVVETDNGTWRRLGLVRFPYTYTATPHAPHERPADPGIRERLMAGRDGRAEAVLAWLVDGARRWYAADRTMPPAPASVVEDTAAWRGDQDSLQGYLSERVVLDPDSVVSAGDLAQDYANWATENHYATLSSRTFKQRFEMHEWVTLGHVRHGSHRVGRLTRSRRPGDFGLPTSSSWVKGWSGVRFRDPNEPVTDVTSSPINPHEDSNMGVNRPTGHNGHIPSQSHVCDQPPQVPEQLGPDGDALPAPFDVARTEHRSIDFQAYLRAHGTTCPNPPDEPCSECNQINVTGRGRCVHCGQHVEAQGHAERCPHHSRGEVA